MAANTGNWEGLRKQARAIENDVDTKLVTFSKLGTNYTRGNAGSGAEDKQPLLSEPETEIEALQHEIEGLLTKLGGINDEMAGYASGAASSGGAAAIHHTLQRHTEILADYRGEFSKTSANIAAIMERRERSFWDLFRRWIYSWLAFHQMISINSTVGKMEAEM